MEQASDKDIPAAKPKPDNTNKAHMLVAMLGREFTKNSENPFFAKLHTMVSQPEMSGAPVPKGALERLLASLPNELKSANPEASQSPDLVINVGSVGTSIPTLRNLGDQHPAVIAHYLAHNAPEARMDVINSLQGATARQAAVYFTRFFSSADRKA